MKKNLILSALIFFALFGIANFGICDDADDWADAIDVYDSDGLDRPVSAIEYQKVMKELQELKEKNQKKKKPFWKKEEPEVLQKVPQEPIKIERNDILKLATPLYYDGYTLPVGFYKITCTQDNDEYFINFLQGKNPLLSVKATKVSHMDFCPDKVNCIKTGTYQDKYYEIKFKTIDYAVKAYLTIVK